MVAIKGIKNKAKRIGLILFAAYMVLAVPANVLAAEEKDMHDYIPPEGNIGSVQDILRNEAHAQLAMRVLSECLGGGINRWEEWGGVTKSTTFFDRKGEDKNINTGYWYEYTLTGKFDNGQIKCGDDTGGHGGPFEIAAEMLSTDTEHVVDPYDLYCNGETAGAVKNMDGYKCGSTNGEYARNGDKSKGDGNDKIDRNKDGNYKDKNGNNLAWSEHLKKKFDEVAEREQWEHRYVETNYYYEMVGYYLYRTEIEIKCGGVAEQYDTKPDNMEMVLTDVTQDGEQAGKVVYKKYATNSTFKHEFVDNKKAGSCKTMIERSNEPDMYGSYRARLVAVLNRECKNDIERRKKEVEESGNEINQATMDAYNKAVADHTHYNSGQFVTGNETEGWKCADIGDFKGARQADPTGDEIYEETKPNCYTNAGSLGWILCPIINQGADFVAGFYEKHVTPYLALDSGLFNDRNKSVYHTWQQFQNYANIAFVIIFLVVIFSQLTGFGIDNYGIKKILPKLIVAAVLINCSYFICQLAIDVANIIGVGVEGIFANVGKVNFDYISVAEGGGGAKNVYTATTILVVLVGVLVAGAVLAGGSAILIPIFLGIITIIVAIITLFILLAVRKALAVILVILSPLAFLTYMLPNTKQLFNRWLTAFKATLLAFPICSFMIFGGQAVARIMIGVAGESNVPFSMALAAAVMSIAPIFFIPSVLKKSMSSVSGMISNVSRGIGNRARGRVGNSRMAHDLERRSQMAKAGVKIGKNGQVELTSRGKLQEKLQNSKVGSKLPGSAGRKRRLNALRAEAIKDYGTQNTDGYTGEQGLQRMQNAYDSIQSADDKQKVKDLEASIIMGRKTLKSGQKVDAHDTKSLQAGLTEAIIDGDTDAIKAYQNVLVTQGDKGRSAIRQAMVDAETDRQAHGGVKAESKVAYAQNIMDNYASDFKENNRTVFEYAAKAQSNPENIQEIYMPNAFSTDTLKASQMINMDDDAFNGLVRQGVDSQARTVDYHLYNAAQAALGSEAAANMKQGRRTQLENIVRMNRRPAPQDNNANGGNAAAGGPNTGSNTGTNGTGPTGQTGSTTGNPTAGGGTA